MIKQIDKGGAFVVWTDVYIAEGKRQLAEEQFYKIPSAATKSSQQEVKTFINTAIESNQLSPAATNLIVEHQGTSKRTSIYQIKGWNFEELRRKQQRWW